MPQTPATISRRKPFYPIGPELQAYLDDYRRLRPLPLLYEQLTGFRDLYPLFDREGNDTFWRTAIYEPVGRAELHHALVVIYTLLRGGSSKVVDHLAIERIDYCQFGNSRPFRIRVVNRFNDNYDHFHIKVADASRIYGLELEHLLSPNRINYMVHEGTLIEEHIVGIPGDRFIADYFGRPETNQVRLAKEFVKFNERCFARLLGDMRSYNYVVDITPDFEDIQYRVRAIDFDQQTYEGGKKIYLPQFYKENAPVVQLCTSLLNYPAMQQYQQEERSLIRRRLETSRARFNHLMRCLKHDGCAPEQHVGQLRAELAEFHEDPRFDACADMSDLVQLNLTVTLGKSDTH